VPGDLRGEGVEDRLAARAKQLEGADVLEPTAVAAADRAQPRVARSVLLDPRQPRDHLHQAADVATLEGRILHVGVAAGGTEPALVEGQHAVPRVQPGLDLRLPGALATPAVAVHDHRHAALRRRAGRFEDRVADVDLRGLARLGDALDAAVALGHRGACRGLAALWIGGRAARGSGQPARQEREGGGEREGGTAHGVPVRSVERVTDG
jgi:hypothetical protein